MARFQTLSVTQNGSTAFRFVRSAVLPLFLFIFIIIRLFRFRYTFYHVNDYGMIDGVINNGRRGEELEKAQEYAERATPEKPSIRERLEDAKRECAEHKPSEGKKPGRDVPEHDCL